MDFLKFQELYHHGIKGQKWGIRRYQNEDGTLTPEGRKRLQEMATLVGKTYSVEMDQKLAAQKGINMIMPKDDYKIYKAYRDKLNKLISKYEKENVSFDNAYRKDVKTGEIFVATVFSNGKHINEMPPSSIYEYKLDLRNKDVFK